MIDRHDPGFPRRYEALRVCMRHGDLYDGLPDEDLETRQFCHDRPAQERWEGFDFNMWVELCRCCVSGTAPSGSRWAPFYCSTCLPRIGHVRETLGAPIPLGRHSLMNGIGLAGAQALSDEAVERFTEGVAAMNRGIAGTVEWRLRCLKALRLRRDDDPTLTEVVAAANQRWTSEQATEAMLDWWGYPT